MLTLEGDWNETIGNVRSQGFHIVEFGDFAGSADEAIDTSATPPHLIGFLEDWHSRHSSPWEAFVRSMSKLPHVRATDVSTALGSAVGQLLQRVVNHATNAAIFSGSSNTFRSPDSWGYLLQIGSYIRDAEPRYFRLYNPVIQQELAKTEDVLHMQLPPSYATLVTITNAHIPHGQLVDL